MDSCGINRGMTPTNPKQTQEQIIERFRLVHGLRYDYSKMSYKTATKKVLIVCPIHGEFFQSPYLHYNGAGCNKCAETLRSNSKRKSLENFIEKLNKKQSKEFVDSLDFTNCIYTDSQTSIKNIKCKKSGTIFTARPSQILRGHCCRTCPLTRRHKQFSEHFFENCKRVHGSRYDYSKSVYINGMKPIIIICKYHGEFSQRPHTHASDRGHGSGCPTCSASRGEVKIELFLKQNNIEHIYQHKVKIDNQVHWYDFYIPEKNLIIEFHGRQHYKLTPFWGEGGGKRALENRKHRDKIKTQWCNANDVNLLVIPYTKYDKIDDILNKNLLSDKQSLVTKS